MRRSTPILAALMLLCPAGRAPAEDGAPRPDEAVTVWEGEPTEERVIVDVGAQRVLPAPGVTRIAIGDPEVADVAVVEGGEVLVTGLARGETTLILWYGAQREDLEVRVVAHRRLEEARATLDVLGLGDRLEALEAGSKLVVRGTVADLDTYERYLRLGATLPDFVDFVRVDGAVFGELASRITEALAAAGIPHARANAVAGTIFLEGQVADEAERDRAERIARAVHEQVVPQLR